MLLAQIMYTEFLFLIFAGANKLSGSDGDNKSNFDAFRREIPLGHAQASWDLGITAVYLASEAARCVNGDTLVSPPPPSSDLVQEDLELQSYTLAMLFSTKLFVILLPRRLGRPVNLHSPILAK